MQPTHPEIRPLAPEKPEPAGFNQKAAIPLGLTTSHIRRAMEEFIDFLGFVDTQLLDKGMTRFEDMLMPANFSSLVGEFMSVGIPKYCKTVAKNQYHNGH